MVNNSLSSLARWLHRGNGESACCLCAGIHEFIMTMTMTTTMGSNILPANSHLVGVWRVNHNYIVMKLKTVICVCVCVVVCVYPTMCTSINDDFHVTKWSHHRMKYSKKKKNKSEDDDHRRSRQTKSISTDRKSLLRFSRCTHTVCCHCISARWTSWNDAHTPHEKYVEQKNIEQAIAVHKKWSD